MSNTDKSELDLISFLEVSQAGYSAFTGIYQSGLRHVVEN